MTEDIEQMEARVRAMFEQAELLKKRIAGMDFELAPVLKQERDLRASIERTHGGPGRFKAATAPDRAPMFDKLTDIAVKHGKTKQQNQQAKRAVKAYLKEITGIVKLVRKMQESSK